NESGCGLELRKVCIGPGVMAA
ncbi:MAG: hypothetical protein JWQ07_5265, partial [Ramlibacter sp.]|nr:hypothetical protein [Ramlibacter sp.]